MNLCSSPQILNRILLKAVEKEQKMVMTYGLKVKICLDMESDLTNFFLIHQLKHFKALMNELKFKFSR